MCGIIYVKRTDGKCATKTLLKRYENQKERGTDGFGYVAIEPNTPALPIRTATEKEIKTALEAEKANEILFHHRFPTSTPNLAEVAHPIEVDQPELLKYRYLVVHNGIIRNDDEMKAKHEKMGFTYRTKLTQKFITTTSTYKSNYYNDSESLAIELALAIENESDKLEAKGDSAFIALQLNRITNAPVALYFGRNEGNPLAIEKQANFTVLASKANGSQIAPHTLYRFDYATGKTTNRDLLVGEKEAEKSYGFGKSWNYPYTAADDEDDFDSYYYELISEKEDIEDEIKAAKRDNDFDRLNQLEVGLEIVNQELREYERKNKHFTAYGY